VERRLVVELKAVEALSSVRIAQVRSYPTAMNLELGLLINFSVVRFRDGGIRRVPNL
jgi:GxxExxY protein